MSEWIRVKDRLPELDKSWRDGGVLVGHYAEVMIFDGEKVQSGTYDEEIGEKGIWCTSEGSITKNVTHWMPLPAPPENQ